MRISIRVKMIISFLLILSFACAVTFFGAVLISSKPIAEEVRQNQFAYADALQQLEKQTNLSTREVLDANVNSMYSTRILDEYETAALDGAVKQQLDRGEKVFVFKNPVSMPTTYLKLGGDIVRINIRRHDVFQVFRLRIALVLLSILAITCAVLALVSGRMLKPILRLTAATQKVAKGDFDISVEPGRNDEIGILIKNFNQMAKELGSMEYLQKDFMRNVSHEFKTPIASIQGFAKLLQNEDLTREERLEFSRIILEETERLSKLSSNILKLSRLENQKELREKKEFFLDEQIRTVIVLLEPKWSQKDIHFEVRMDKTAYRGDEELLQQVWINLIENAVKFSERGGTIDVTVSRTGQFAEARIKDYGTGMDEETRQRIFERFYQGNPSHADEGSGLGLSIVKRILELSGGEIQVKSSPGQGTEFLVRLPY